MSDYTPEQKDMKIPRRIRLDQSVPAELAIRDAIHAVEAVGADVRLTAAVVLLSRALHQVSDYVDGVTTPDIYQGVDAIEALAEVTVYLTHLLATVAPQCEPLSSAAGIATQIDNYIVGRHEALAAKDKEIATLTADLDLRTQERDCAMRAAKRQFDLICVGREKVRELLVTVGYWANAAGELAAQDPSDDEAHAQSGAFMRVQQKADQLGLAGSEPQ